MTHRATERLASALAVLAALASSHCGSNDEAVAPGDGGVGDVGGGDADAGQDVVSQDALVFDVGSGDADQDASEAGDAETTGCGDGKIQPGEVCDDGNGVSGDGCSAACDAVENDYACPYPGEECVSTVVCGDRRVSGTETCDDGNQGAGDGCDSACQIEVGWACPVVGERCMAAACGDGIRAGNEECDDGVLGSGDGCSSDCKVEPGWACDTPGEACHPAICGDGTREGDEPCDDGNDVVGDGCNPFCEVEPDCTGGGACASACGDGMILPGDEEECDDGNTKGGDGCSGDCKVEVGFACETIVTDLPDELEVPVTFRDFISLPVGGGIRHPDFQIFGGSDPTPGLVQPTLGTDGKPVYTGICELGSLVGPCPWGAQTTSQLAFDQWYRDVPTVNVTEVAKMVLARLPNGSYYFPDAAFFPLDGKGWIAAGLEQTSDGHNFGFTSELRTWFEFKGGEELQFAGDDDVWVFINRRLVVDLGGLHPQRSGGVTLDDVQAQALQLEVGKIYETVLFHAERRTNASNFNLTLTGFVQAKSRCASECGDGILAGDEACDDGVNDGSWGSCTEDCRLGPYCGDGEHQAPYEECDDGINLTPYSTTGQPGCAPGCTLGAYCGDAKVDSLFGEQCDDGQNEGGYGGCTPLCRLDARCGDGDLDTAHGEECDDGNTVSGDGCSADCGKEGPK
jgi:fibro-slime domain-containing protein